MAWVLPQLENEVQDKHVENVWFPCLDEGSNPSSSTLNDKKLLIFQRLFFILILFSLRKRQQKTIYNNSFCIFAHTEDCFFPQEGLFLRTQEGFYLRTQERFYLRTHKQKKDRPKTKNHARGQQHLFLTFCCASVNIAHDRMQQ